MKAHEHNCGGPEQGATTGFLPISLALGLFITGLFVLDLVPSISCSASAAAPPTATVGRPAR